MQQVHPILFEEIDAELVIKAAKYTKVGSGPSGLDAYAWRKLLTGITKDVSRVYGDCAQI